MLIYNLAYAYVALFGIFTYHFKKDSRALRSFYLISSGIILVLIAGTRYGMGFDFFTFKNDYVAVSAMNLSDLLAHRYEPGFMIFMKILTLITKNSMFLYIASSAVMVFCAFFVIAKQSKLPYLSILLYMSIDFYASGMNLLRYTMAAMFFFLAIPFLKKSGMDYTKENRKKSIILSDLKQNFLPYLLIVLFAGTFHKSVFLMIPFYFILKIPFNKITAIIYTVGGFSAFFLARPVGQFFSDVFFSGSYDLSIKDDFSTPGGLFHMIFPMIYFIFALAFHKKLLEKDKNNVLFINAAIYNFVIYTIAALNIFIFTRITIFFDLFIILLIPEIVNLFAFSKLNLENLKTAKKISEAKSIYSGKKTDYILALIVSLSLIVSIEGSNRSMGSHRIYPYMSQFQSVNKFSHVFLDKDREKKKQYIKGQVNVGQYIKSVYDEKYIVIISSQGEAFSPRAYYFALEPLLDFGTDLEKLVNQHRNGFLAVYQMDKSHLEVISDKPIIEQLSLPELGLELELSAGSYRNRYPASIIINGEQYSQDLEGLNFVIYDTQLEQVVDIVNFDTFAGTQFFDREPEK